VTAEPAGPAAPIGPRARLAVPLDGRSWTQQQRFTALQALTAMERDSVLWHLCSTVPGAVERAYRVVTSAPDPGPVLPDPAGFLPGFYDDLPGPDESALQLDLELGGAGEPGPGLALVAGVDEDQADEPGAVDEDQADEPGAVDEHQADRHRRRGGKHRRQ
jgi:hypothetical protein